MRSIVRRSTTIIAVPFLAVLYLNIETFAVSLGWDGLLIRYAPMVEYLTTSLALALSTLVVGIVIGMWVDLLLRNASDSQSDIQRAINTYIVSVGMPGCEQEVLKSGIELKSHMSAFPDERSTTRLLHYLYWVGMFLSSADLPSFSKLPDESVRMFAATRTLAETFKIMLTKNPAVRNEACRLALIQNEEWLHQSALDTSEETPQRTLLD